MSNKNKDSSKSKKDDKKEKQESAKRRKTHVEVTRKLAIPVEKLEEYKQSFDYFDRDKSGEITIDELKSLLSYLGRKSDESRVKAMIDELDQNGDGTITFEEYVTIMEKNEGKTKSMKNLRKILMKPS